jgi:hypothetical protein
MYSILLFNLVACVSLPHGSFYLGEQTVPFQGEQGTIDVGDYGGWFRAIYFYVEKSDAELFNMFIIYENGDKEEIHTRLIFNANTRSRVINLEGGKRHIRSVDFVYKTVGSWVDGKATIRIYGMR